METDIDPDFAADQIVDNLRAMECDTELARKILALCELKIQRGELWRETNEHHSNRRRHGAFQSGKLH